ncbi:MAG TPA: response regulator [Hyphomicrobiaceae bacterium]|nr:response regulator [Hyphomicrobiaceae bacterium]
MGLHIDQAVASRASPGLKGRRILVAEDDWFIADAMAGLLESQGASVFGPAATVAEGAQLARWWPIDVAVIDLNLHGERADRLVVELADNDIPVVVVTAYDIMQMAGAKAFAILHKPVTSAILLDTICRALA